MLTLIVLRTGYEKADEEKTVASVRDLSELEYVYYIDHLPNIPKILTDWYLLLTDCEVVDPELLAAFPIFMEEGKWDFLSIYKRNFETKEFTYKPRLFKKEVCLDLAGIPVNALSRPWETILNGFISEGM